MEVDREGLDEEGSGVVREVRRAEINAGLAMLTGNVESNVAEVILLSINLRG